MIKMIIASVALLISTADLPDESPTMFKKCQTCHGKQLLGKKKSPAIRGLSYEKLYASLTTDIPKKMRRTSSKLTKDQKVALSKYISGLENE